VGQHLIVPSIGSRDVAWAQRSSVRHRKHAFKPLDVVNNLLSIHYETSIANHFCSPRARASIVPRDAETQEARRRARHTQGMASNRGFPRTTSLGRAALGNEGMPVKRQERYVESSPKGLNGRLRRESAGEPVQIAAAGTDLSAELRRGLTFVRKQAGHNKKAA